MEGEYIFEDSIPDNTAIAFTQNKIHAIISSVYIFQGGSEQCLSEPFSFVNGQAHYIGDEDIVQDPVLAMAAIDLLRTQGEPHLRISKTLNLLYKFCDTSFKLEILSTPTTILCIPVDVQSGYKDYTYKSTPVLIFKELNDTSAHKHLNFKIQKQKDVSFLETFLKTHYTTYYELERKNWASGSLTEFIL
jgi:hypothetical protein